MQPSDYAIWPKHLPTHLNVPKTTLCHHLEVAARLYPNKPAIIFYDSEVTYREFYGQVEALAGFLQHRCKVARGDRVLLDLQNSPQFLIGYYAILRADAVVVPVSPMNVTAELDHYFSDSGARTAILSQDLLPRFEPLLGSRFDNAILATYSDYLTAQTSLAIPDLLKDERRDSRHADVYAWMDATGGGMAPHAARAVTDDLCAILYTSGTTGQPKGCMHTHQTILTTAMGGALWAGMDAHSVALATAPMFHVTGMQHSMNAPVFSGGAIALLPRWDPAVAGAMIERYRCTHWANVPTMVVDLLAHPDTRNRDMSSLKNIFGGGLSMPEAVAQQLYERCGIRYMEGYGMTETISQTHINPPGDLRKQCLGIPTFDTESIVVDPQTLQPVPRNEPGEILSRGPQLFKGYWNNPQATEASMVEISGKRFLRTGDLGRVDKDGFFYISDRLKRMINASGYKVWPAEVESALYRHPGIKEAAVVSAPGGRRGETVKAYVVLKDGAQLDEKSIIAWSRDNMAAYKIPRKIEFLGALPRSGTGKIQWRLLQEREWREK
ncbi:MAG: long-chain-fatty-acid--CoA ligase [Burkholderiales bacterium]